jgi:hypothetical protein
MNASNRTSRNSVASATNLSRGPRIVSWIAQFITAGILAQTLFFKFTYAPETQYIFKDMGGRPVATLVGCVELLCVVLLLIPRLASIGALLSLMTISGAIFSHLTKLGIVIPDPATGQGDGGLLFGLAVTIAALSLVVLMIRRMELVANVRSVLSAFRTIVGGDRQAAATAR